MCPYYKKEESQINDMTFQLKKIKYIYIYIYVYMYKEQVKLSNTEESK